MEETSSRITATRIRYGVRYAYLAVRHPALRTGPRFVAGPGLLLRVERTGKIRWGKGLVLRRNVTFTISGTLEIGENVFVNESAYVSVHGTVRIGNRVRFGERVSIHDQNHVFEPLGRPQRNDYIVRDIHIGDDVWLGANVVVVAGAVIGDSSVIAANSVVRGHIPPGVLAAGIPARIVRPLRNQSDNG
jgi:acetyltransferase-like isoleucine patch superfamily enzyme